MIARIWSAALAHGSVRLWAIILGAPPLCVMLSVLVGLIRWGWSADTAALRLSILGNIAYGLVFAILIIVVALATVKVRATTPAGSVDIGGADEAEG